MRFGSFYGFRPYVSVATRRLQAQRAAKKLASKGRTLDPVRIDSRAIVRTFWGQAWCRNLEAYSDYANRLPRGRTYVRNGSVLDLQIAAGVVTALVQGSSLYTIKIAITPLDAQRWREFKGQCAGRVTNLLDLLQGRLSKEILAAITAPGSGLFPAPKEIQLDCSCPDWAGMCKHLAAVLYGVGARLDREPALFFTLRGVNMEELVSAASHAAVSDMTSGEPALADADLAEIFGVEIELGSNGRTAPVEATNATADGAAPKSNGRARDLTRGHEATRTGRKHPAKNKRPRTRAK